MASEDTEKDARPASEKLRIADHKAPVLPMFAIAFVASVIGIILGLLIDWFPPQAVEQAEGIDTFYDVLIICSVPMFVLVTSVVLYCVYFFKMRPGEEQMDGPPLHGNTRLEVVWTVIPALMMLALCSYAWVELNNAEEAPANPAQEMRVRVVGEQFAWTFFYPPEREGGEETASTQLYLPTDRSVLFRVQTKDVLHDFWVPAFRWKVDAVPGITTEYRVTPNRVGKYPIVCAELCGLGHAVMRQTAHVLPQREFTAWLTKERAAGAEGGGGAAGGGAAAGGGGGAPEADGEKIFADAQCGSCHVLGAAGASGTIGPNLDEALKGQDAAAIEQSIVEPGAKIAEGFDEGIMPPNFGQTLQPEEIEALVKYLMESTS